MTPEQREKINHILQHQDFLDGDFLDLVMTDNDALTAEVDRLKGEVEKDRCVTCLYCNTHFQYEKIDEATFNVLYQKMWEHDAVCQANPNVQMIATLRTRLDALVTAVNEAIGIAENIRNLDPKIGADEIIDALAAAVREATGEK